MSSTSGGGGGGGSEIKRREWKNLSNTVKKQLVRVGREGPLKIYGYQTYDPLLGEASIDFVSADYNLSKNVVPKGRIMTIPWSWYKDKGYVRPYNKDGGRRRKTRRMKKKKRGTRRH
jgi:hypothetical protein